MAGLLLARHQLYETITEVIKVNRSYEIITGKIVHQLERGIIPWQCPWFGVTGPISHLTGRPYSALNTLLLGLDGENVENEEFITWNQIQKYKKQNPAVSIIRGSKARTIYFWRTFEKTEVNDKGEAIVVKQVPYLRSYNVFRVRDCVGIEPRWQSKPENQAKLSPIQQAEDVVQKYLNREKIALKHDNANEAFYHKKLDYINVPPISNFKVCAEDYYGTLLHEMVHSTGAESRLCRFSCNGSPSPFGSQNYSREELVAEIGSAFLMNKIGIETKNTFEQSAAYIQGWLRALQNDKSLIALAAGRAEKAVHFILGENVCDDVNE